MMKRTVWAIVLTSVLAMAVAPASAAVYTVGTGGTYAGDWAGLQSAITAAAGGANEVRILGGITIARPTSTTDLLRASGDTSTVTISGGWSSDFSAQSGGATVVDAALHGRAFQLDSPTVLANMTIQNGYVNASSFGIAVNATAQVRLSHLAVLDNSTAASTGGAGVYFTSGAAGSVVEYSTFSGNVANPTSGRGAAIYNNGAANVLIANSVFYGNEGAIENKALGTIVYGSLFYGNDAASGPSVLENPNNATTFRFVNSTIADNAAGDVSIYNASFDSSGAYRQNIYNTVISQNGLGVDQSSTTRVIRLGYTLVDGDALDPTIDDVGGNQTSGYTVGFVDRTNGTLADRDYSLDGTSTAIDMIGVSTSGTPSTLMHVSSWASSGDVLDGASFYFINTNADVLDSHTYVKGRDVIIAVDGVSFDDATALAAYTAGGHYYYPADLAGNARLIGGALDMGAYEYAVPEPATLGFLALGGLAMAAGAVRRRRRKA